MTKEVVGFSSDFKQRAENCNLTICIVGLGYVGLPTMIGFYESGFNVRGLDNSETVISNINRGINPLADPEIDNKIPINGSERWFVSSKPEDVIKDSDVIIITVPTPITDDLKPNLSYVEMASKAVFSNINPAERVIVVLESTVYPGVTKEIWLPLLNNLDLKIGIDVELAYCPERFSPGDPNRGIRDVARVVGTENKEIGLGLVKLYSKLTEGNVSYVPKIEIAEAAKVVENVQRDINIALVNELARIFPELGVDVEDVLTAAESKWNFHRYTPGVGVGGHCIPVDPYYLKQRAEEVGVPAELISAARSVNRSMPQYVSNTIKKIFSDLKKEISNSKIAFLGWSYKPRIGDDRKSPAITLANNLIGHNAKIYVYDPYVNPSSLPTNVVRLENLSEIQGFDMIILHTAHPEFEMIDWEELGKRMINKIVYDGRRVLPIKTLEKLGWYTYAIGKPIEFNSSEDAC